MMEFELISRAGGWVNNYFSIQLDQFYQLSCNSITVSLGGVGDLQLRCDRFLEIDDIKYDSPKAVSLIKLCFNGSCYLTLPGYKPGFNLIGKRIKYGDNQFVVVRVGPMEGRLFRIYNGKLETNRWNSTVITSQLYTRKQLKQILPDFTGLMEIYDGI